MFLVRRIVGKSMAPTLRPGRLVIARRVFGKIVPGDVVIFRYQDKDMIKRVAHIDEKGLFLVGDNGAESVDSRHFGFMPTDAVVGRVIAPRR